MNATFCFAVGFQFTDGGIQLPVGAVWNGTGWKLTPPATPYYEYGVFDRVSCVASSSCLAVGFASGPLIELWNGSAWESTLAPAPTYPLSASCVPGGFCAVGGAQDKANGGSTPTAAWLDGGRWTYQTIAPGDGNRSGGLNGMSCLSASNCVAVGTSSTGGAIAAAWDGTAWSVQQLPETAGVSDVSCSDGVCMAVGGLMSEQN